MIYYGILVIMTLMGAVASLFLKKASAANGISGLLRDFNLYIGGGLYFLSSLLNIFILRYLDYSIVLPLTSITYIWTMGISAFSLNEKITKKQMAGVFLIVLGAVLVAR